MVSLGKRSGCPWEECVFCCWWMKWSVSTSPGKWVCSGGHFPADFLPTWSISYEEKGVKSTTISVGLSVSSCSPVSFGFIYFEGSSVIRWIFRIAIVSCWSDPFIIMKWIFLFFCLLLNYVLWSHFTSSVHLFKCIFLFHFKRNSFRSYSIHLYLI